MTDVLAHPARVMHIPQVPGAPFIAPARSVAEAAAIAATLAAQHLWLLEKGIISDYSNVIMIQVWDGEEWEALELQTDVEVEYLEFVDAVLADKP